MSEDAKDWTPWTSRRQAQRVRERIPAHLLGTWTPQPDDKVFIYSREHSAYWRESAAGYTATQYEAGIYTLTEAEEVSGHAGPEKGIEYRPVPAVVLVRRAGPDLYDALELILLTCSVPKGAQRNQAERALAKARGED